MRIRTNNITIELEEDEINTFWNIVAFALDLDAKEHRMTNGEREMAKSLYEKTKNHY